jgi:hypothetical protein
MKRNHNSITRLLTAVLMLFMVPALLIAQTPTTFNYQAVLRNTDGTTKSNVNVNIGMEIHQATETGTVVYSETHSTTTNDFGMVNLEIGSVIPATFATIDWAAGPYFVEVIVDGLSMGTSELLTVPYALHAETAESITGTITETDPVYTGSQAANISATDIANLSNLSGTNSGDQNISGIGTNASAISAIQGEQSTQNAAIALNTAKVGLTAGQITVLGNTSGTNTGDQDGSETHVNAGANVSVTGTGTAGSPYIVNADGIISYAATGGGGQTVASTSTTTSLRTQVLQLVGVPAGTYAVFFSSPISNGSTSSLGVNLAWAIKTNGSNPGFPGDGIASSFIPATGWTLSYIFGQSGFKVVTLGSTGTIELVVVYYGNILTGTVMTTGIATLRAIRL